MALERPPGSGGNGLSQQFDWGQLAARTVTFTVDVLSRLSAANVDSYTVEVGRLVSSQFKVSRDGRSKIMKALSELKSYGSLGDIMWFGFGARHVVRSMPSTDEGCTCLALCGVMSEYYTDTVSPEIFYELVRKFNIPLEGTPSILQWQSLVRACAGTLARSSFGEVVEQMIQHNPYVWQSSSLLDRCPSRPSNASPMAVAEALQGVGAVSRGEIKAITIMGGNDAGWLAAISVWLFDLRVTICDSLGNQLYSSYSSEEQTQVKIIYTAQHADDSPPEIDDLNGSQQLSCIGKTFILTNAAEVFRKHATAYTAHNSGRVRWEHIFRTCFGQDFTYLLENQGQTLASSIGSAARLFYGITHAEDGVPRYLFENWQTYVSGSYGRGYVQNIMEWFPELSHLSTSAEHTAKMSLAEAKTTYEQQMVLFKNACSCINCRELGPAFENSYIESICYPAMVETILILGFSLSEMEVEEGLLPKRTGVQRIYKRQLSSWTGVKLAGSDPLLAQLGPFVRVCRYTPKRFESTILGGCIELFAGNGEAQPDDYTAVCQDGICAYRCVLNNVSDDLDVSGKIFVLPGSITYRGKPYDHVADANELYKSVSPQTLDSVHLYSQVTFNIMETVDELLVWFELSAKNSSAAPTIMATPLSFVSNLNLANGWVNCSNRHCREIVAVPQEENSVVDVAGIDFRIIRGHNIARCAAIASVIALADQHTSRLILKRNNCWQCCVQTGLRGMGTCSEDVPRSPRYVIVGSQG